MVSFAPATCACRPGKAAAAAKAAREVKAVASPPASAKPATCRAIASPTASSAVWAANVFGNAMATSTARWSAPAARITRAPLALYAMATASVATGGNLYLGTVDDDGAVVIPSADSGQSFAPASSSGAGWNGERHLWARAKASGALGRPRAARCRGIRFVHAGARRAALEGLGPGPGPPGEALVGLRREPRKIDYAELLRAAGPVLARCGRALCCRIDLECALPL